MDHFKHKLAKEAETRVETLSKEAAFDREGMAYWPEMENHKGQSTLEVTRSDFNWRKMAQIKQSIQETFEHFLMQPRRANARGGKFRIVPQVTDDSASDDFEPGASLYYRFNVVRRVFPQRPPAQAKSQNLLIEIEKIVGSSNLVKMADFCEQNGIPVLPYYAVNRRSGGRKAELLLNLLRESEQRWWKLQRAESDKYLKTVEASLAKDPNQLHIDDIEIGSAMNERQVRQISRDAPLMRMLVYKMAAGYVLDERRLRDLLITDYEEVLNNQSENRQFGEANDSQREEVYLHYRKTISTLLAIYHLLLGKMKKIGDLLRQSRNFVQAWHFGPEHLNLPITPTDVRVDPKTGKDVIRGFKLNTPYPISIRDLQTLVISVNTAMPNRALNATMRSFDIDPNVWVDRRRYIFVPPDGLSDNPRPGMRETDAHLVIAPVTFIMGKAHWDKDNITFGRKHLVKRRAEIEALFMKYGTWCKQAYQLLDRAVKGKATSPELARIFGTVAHSFTGANILHNLLQEYGDPSNPNNLAASAKIFTEKFIKQKLVGAHRKAPEGEEADWDGGGEVADEEFDLEGRPTGDDVSPLNPVTYKALRTYGYYVAKMMELIYGVGHISTPDVYGVFASSPGRGKAGVGARYRHTRFDAPETDPDQGIPGITVYGVGHGTSSGIGRGSEMIIACRFAYSAEFVDTARAIREQVLSRRKNWSGTGQLPSSMEVSRVEQLVKRKLDEIPKKRRQRALTSNPPGFQGRLPTVRPEQLEDNMTDVGGFIVTELPEYFLGMSSTQYDPREDRHRVGMAKTRVVGKSWTQILSEVVKREPALRTEIWPLNMNMDMLRNQVKQGLDAARRSLAASLRKFDKKQPAVPPVPAEAEPAEDSVAQAEWIFVTDDGKTEVIHQSEYSTQIIGADPSVAQEEPQPQMAVAPEPSLPATPATPEVMPETPIDLSTRNETPVQQAQEKVEETPAAALPKSMEAYDPTEKILKRDKIKTLPRRPISRGQRENLDVLKELVEAAEFMDAKGQFRIADKLDKLASLIKSNAC